MKPRLDKNIQTILVLGGINSLFWVVFRGVIMHADSASFIEAADVVIKGDIDSMRTPGYPFFLGCLKALFGTQLYLYAVILVQHLVFLLSAACLYRLAERIISQSSSIPFYLTLIYILHPFIASWNNYIVPESFSISGTAFLVYLTVNLRDSAKWKTGLLSGLVLTWLLLLKPAMIFLLPLLALLWICTSFAKAYRKNALIGMVAVAVGACCILCYMDSFKKQYGIFSTSYVGTLNQYHIARKYGILNPVYVTDSGIRTDLQKSIETAGDRPDDYRFLFHEAEHMISVHSLPSVHAAIAHCNRQQPGKAIRAIVGRLYEAANDPLLVSHVYKSRYGQLFCFHVSSLFFFLVIYTALLCIWIVRTRKIPWITVLLFMVGISQIVVSVIGAQSAWGRLVLPALPVYFLMIGQVLHMIGKITPSLKFQ